MTAAANLYVAQDGIPNSNSEYDLHGPHLWETASFFMDLI